MFFDTLDVRSLRQGHTQLRRKIVTVTTLVRRRPRRFVTGITATVFVNEVVVHEHHLLLEQSEVLGKRRVIEVAKTHREIIGFVLFSESVELFDGAAAMM